ncbi:unnamed protein product [Cuscuta epithymum]|uniref:GRDP C2 domain-containing protein n=1 Tax=Cuscuta epithymum TaxID=186058 RepID=A0AAV0CYV1_9ASTE|nr:unnamed protein product [Cuscuta epithymum]
MLYGTILDNYHVASSTKGMSKGETEKVWKQLYPSEPFELEIGRALSCHEPSQTSAQHIKCMSNDYDLVSAVKRQSSFFMKVSRPLIYNELYLKGAVDRYKGFLHLIKRNEENFCCVPTRDIDLIWHTHQLHPVSYCKDLMKLLGKVAGHNGRVEHSKLQIGFSTTTKLWERTYGRRYYRDAKMYRRNSMLPLEDYHDHLSHHYTTVNKKISTTDIGLLRLPETGEVLEVMLESIGLKNVPEEEEGRKLFVAFSKEGSDRVFHAKGRLDIPSPSPMTTMSNGGEYLVTCFQCEPSGNLIFELMSEPWSSSNNTLPLSHEPLHVKKTMGSFSVSLGELLSAAMSSSSNNNNNKLVTMEKWFQIAVVTADSNSSMISKPIFLGISISVSMPTKTPYVLHMIPASPRPPKSKSSSLFHFNTLKNQHWTRVVDECGNQIIHLQMSGSKYVSKGKSDSISKGEVIALTNFGDIFTLAELRGKEWSLVNCEWSICFPKATDDEKDDGHLLKMTGASRTVCAYGLQLRMLMTLQEYKLAGHAFRLSFIENTKIKENELSLEHISLGICTTLNVLQKFLICQGG